MSVCLKKIRASYICDSKACYLLGRIHISIEKFRKENGDVVYGKAAGAGVAKRAQSLLIQTDGYIT